MSRPAPVAVLGLGGIGGMLAARTGAVCVGTGRTVAAIRHGGLRLVHDGTTTVVRTEAVERLERPVSLLVVAVKAYDLEEALERIAAPAIADAVVLPLLNGLEHVEALRAWLDNARVESTRALPAVAAGSIGGVEAFSPEPGLVVQRSPGAVVRAASEALGRDALSARLEPLRAPGLDVVVADGERAVLWEKAARLAVLAAATVASGETIGVLRADGAWRDRAREALAEACAVAAAEGVDVDPAGQWAIIDSLPAELTTSTARDALAGRPTELDAIAGSVLRAAARAGVATPTLEGLVADARAGAAS